MATKHADTAPEIPGNNELLGIADQLDTENSLIPPTKAEVVAQEAAEDAKKAALEQTAAIVRKGLTAAAGAACAKYPALVTVWTEKAIDRIAVAAAAVLLKYGVESEGFMAKYAEEIELIMALGEPMVATYFIVKKVKELEAKQAGGEPTGLGNGTVEPTADGAPQRPIVLA